MRAPAPYERFHLGPVVGGIPADALDAGLNPQSLKLVGRLRRQCLADGVSRGIEDIQLGADAVFFPDSVRTGLPSIIVQKLLRAL